jgi:hypothetical protein
MKPIAEVYPQYIAEFEEDGSFYGPGDYGPMLDSFGYETLLQVDDHDYQGDSRLLYKDGGRIGYLNFGWGSCSGCDSLQACSSPSDLEELQQRLFNSITWFDSAAEALAWFNEHDWEGDYSWNQDEQTEFVTRAKEILGQL